jgi:uncharacterized protein (TIGR02996 family)
MTTTEERLVAAVAAAPHDDTPRRAYAAWVRPYDEPRAQLIDAQLAWAEERRRTNYRARGAFNDPGESLVKRHQHQSRWSRTLLRYARSVRYYRGFIEGVVIDPFLFLEYGEWLFANAPIIRVTFVRPEAGSFPVHEVASSPLLRRLDDIGLADLGLQDEDVSVFASSPHINALWLDLSGNELSIKAFDALARNVATRRLLAVARWQGYGADSKQYWPGQTDVVTDRLTNGGEGNESEWGPVQPEGQALERTYGYLPWLHKANSVYMNDARWFVNHGLLPVSPRGLPVE